MRSATRVAAFVGFGLVALLIGAVVAGAAAARGAEPAAQLTGAVSAPAAAADVALPLAFTANRGQTDPQVRYYAMGSRFGFYLTRDEVLLSFAKTQNRGLALALRFVGKNAAAMPEGAAQTAGSVNDLRGSDPSRWHTQIPSFGRVIYRDLWPGIDLDVQERAGVLKYEFRVRPGARPAAIRLAYAGARSLEVSPSGALLIRTGLGVVRDSAPVAYQQIGGRRVPVQSRYALQGNRRFAFTVGDYRRDRELIIDPGIQYTTFLGGASHEVGAGIAVNSGGNVYVAGTTQSPNFPTTTGAFARTGAAGNFSDIFVSKLNPAGTALVYSTFVGGSDLDFGRRLAVDAAGNAYVTGQTKSSNFPTTNGAFSRALHIPPNCPRCATDNTDGFAFKLNAAGSALTYSTYLGGVEYDSPRGIAVDSAGNAYIAGETLSPDFPTTAGAFNRTYRGNYDIFVTKLNSTGRALVYSTFVGGTQVDNGERVSVDAAGSAYVMGFTSSTDFPTTAGAFDTTQNGGFDVSLTKLNAAGSALIYSTYLGGQGSDSGGGLAVDGAGNAYVAGDSTSADFPTTAGAFDRTGDGADAFVTKLNAAGSATVYSTFVGGSVTESFSSIAVDPAGNAWLSGGTNSPDFPVTPGAADPSLNGGSDVVITELAASGSALLYSTFLGGSQSEFGYDITRDPTGDVYVTGLTYSMDFPATVGAFDTIFNGDTQIFWGDAFVTKLDLDATVSTPTAPPAVPSAPTLTAPGNGESVAQPITFDWNDVPSAASYTIQIDDSSTFGSPARNESLPTSVYGTTGLPAVTHFWRVRGVNSAGVPGAWSSVRTVSPQAPPPPATLTNLDLNPSTVVGGNATSGTLIFSVGAPFGGAVVSLSSSNPSVAAVPATVTAPANSFVGLFTVTTSPVTTSTTVTITASYNGSTRTALLTATGQDPAPPAAALQALTINPASVTGGAGSQGTVFLSGPAPQGGAIVTLASNGSAASVPASVTVPAGTTTAAFTISTSTVSASTVVTLTATYNGLTRTAGISVQPVVTQPQTATLTVTATGRSGERVTSSPTGISVSVGSSGSASFTAGTSITLSATNGRSVVWSGGCSSGGNKVKTCTFTLSAAATVTANVQ